MALPTQFNYFRPNTIEETLRLMSKFGAQSKILVGGTDLTSGVRSGKIILPENIIEIGHVKELNFIDDAADIVNVGATTKLSEIMSSPIIKSKVPILVEAITTMASFQVRNMGTIGGNLCNASPAADTAPPLLVLDAMIEVMNIKSKRRIPIDQFFTGPSKTAAGPDEIVTKIQIPKQQPTDRWDFVKLGRRKALTLSIISIAALAKIVDNRFQDVKIALGAVAPTPLRAKKAETFLKGRSASEDVIDEASQIVRDEINPISDVRASKEYRREMAYTITKKMLMNLSSDKGCI